MVLPRPTRQIEEPNCSCYICLTGYNITRKPAYQKKTYDGNIEKGHGLFGYEENKLPNDNNLDEYKPVINICSKCKQEVGRGKTHKCSISSTSFQISNSNSRCFIQGHDITIIKENRIHVLKQAFESI